MKKTRWPIWLTALLILASGAYFFIFLDQASIRNIMLVHRALLPLLVVIAIATQLIKATRMYVIMMDTTLSYPKNLLLYASTTVINIMTPYKIGEVYRIALYGKSIDSYAGGAVRVLLDRAVDTAALLTYLTLILLFQVSAVLPLYLLLLALFVLFCAAWFVFPQLYRFWNDFLITQRHTQRAASVLRVLSDVNRAYEYLRGLIRGRVFIMYLLSMAAWGLELVGVYALTVYTHSNSASQISAYLDSALSTAANEHQKLYVLCYLAVLAIMMLVSAWLLKRRRNA
jgi:hypothetical protein